MIGDSLITISLQTMMWLVSLYVVQPLNISTNCTDTSRLKKKIDGKKNPSDEPEPENLV